MKPLRGVLYSIILLALVGLAGMPMVAQAAEKFCSDPLYNGVIDGNVLGTAPVQITIDTHCTFQNWPISNPLSTNINFQTNDPTPHLIIFDNVYYTGNMACANIPHKLWVVNSSEDAFSGVCQDLIIPAETIDKQSPVSSVGIGEQFTYRLVLPSMDFPAGDPSPNDIGDVVVTDDLNDMGAALTLIGTPTVTFAGSGSPVSHTFSNVGGLLTFVFDNTITSGQQIYIDITLEVDNDPVANVAGTQINNIAEWQFSRSIDLDENGIIEDGTVDLDGDGIIEDEFFNPLPGESGVADPITISEPSLIVTKSSNQTAINIGVTALFTLDVHNIGGSDAWDITLTDYLPDEPSAQAGMCDTDPGATITAEVFEADGVTSVSGPLVLNTDFTVSYSGSPSCEFTFTAQSASAVIGPSERLVITYESQLDGGTTGDIEPLTNIVGADLWYSGPVSTGNRREYDKTITDGTPGVSDFQDAYTVTTALSGYYFEKTATNMVTGALPAETANVGDTIRFTLRLFNVDQTINGISIFDTIDSTRFDLDSFTMVDAAGASYTFNSSTGALVINGSPGSLDIAQGDELSLIFEVDLLSTLSNGDVAANQATIYATQNTASLADDFVATSDDPYLNGVADPSVNGDEDATEVTIETPGPLSKSTTQASATIGEQFTYTLTIPATPINTPLYDVRILDDLSASAADLTFVSASVVSGGSWAVVNSGTATDVVLEDTVTGIDIPAGGQAVIAITVALENTNTNQRDLVFSNTASYTYNRLNNQTSSQIATVGSSSGTMVITEPDLAINKAVRFVSPAGKSAADTATVGDILEYEVTLTNTGNATAYDISITDTLPTSVSLVSSSAVAEINGVAVAGFQVDPDTTVVGQLIWGALNQDGSLDVVQGASLVLTYQVSVDETSGGVISNAVVAEWTSLDDTDSGERDGAGCPAIVAPNDYCVGPVTVDVSAVDDTTIGKSVVFDTYAESPASAANPVVRVGDSVTYELTLDLQEYTTRSVVVEDTLPAGMAYASLESITPASGAASFTYSVNSQPAAGDTGVLTWDLGDVFNAPSNDGTPIDTLVIRYSALVIADAAPTGISTATSSQLDNNASLTYTGGDPATYPDRLTAVASIDVLQPRMSAITKVDTLGGRTGSGVSFDPYQVDILADTMQFRVESCNNGLAPAYAVTLQDQFPNELDEADLISGAPVVSVGGATLAEGVDYTISLPSRGGVLEIALQDSAPVNPGECVTVDYSVGFHSDIPPFSTWNNAASLTEYRSLPLAQSGRIYNPADVAQVYMTNQLNIARLLKTRISSDQATIGDEVVYQIRVPATLQNATLDNVVVTDSLPSALEYVSATAVDGGGNAVSLTDNSVAPDQVNLGIAQITAGEQVVITLTTRVQNSVDANAGDSFTNTASYTYTGLDPAADTSGTSEPVTLTEPLLQINKTVTNLTTPGAAPVAGDTLRYNLAFTASGGAADDIYTDAFDLRIDDSLSLGLLYIAGSATVDGTGNTIAEPQDNGADGVNTAQTLVWDLAAATADVDVVEGTVVNVTYDVEVLAGVQAGQELTNAASVQWTNLEGPSSYERDGSNSPAVNDYYAGPSTTTLTTRLDVSLVKSVVNVTSGQNPGDNAEPGDTLQYTLVLTNNSIVPITNGVFTDSLAAWFKPGSLVLSGYPASANISGTDINGGSNGTGLVDISQIALAAAGDAGGADSITIEFSAQLADVIDSGTSVENTGYLTADNLPATPSNTAATLIASAPQMRVEKTSEDLTGDAAVLEPGDTLRYTITVKNQGNENAIDVALGDLVPTFTTYVAGSTTLNGAPVADPAAGVSPLQDGMLLYAPENPTPGVMRADASATTDNVATVTFDVTVNTGVVGGTVISNQGHVNGSGAGNSGPFAVPSDDPDTPVADDPTLDVVGYAPLLDALKTVALQVDNGSAGVIDAGDVLRYTIVISNFGAVDATGVNFLDAVPGNTAYVANSTYLNDVAIGQPDGGLSPLAAGIAVSSDDGAATGVITAGGTATIRFDVMVDGAATPGTLISNQGVVSSNEQADEPTDADGIDSNGDQPTISVVGDLQLLAITKEVFDVDGGVVLPGDELEYVVTVRNIGTLPATDVRIQDNLDQPTLDQLNYRPDSARLNGSETGISFADPVLTADYSSTYGDLEPDGTVVLRFRAYVDPAQVTGTTITNIAQVYWNADNQTDTASVSVVVGAPPSYTGTVGGTVWHDFSDDKLPDANEPLMEGWTVELYRNNMAIAQTDTDENGHYSFFGLAPNDMSTDVYRIGFTAPGAGTATALLGVADSPYVNTLHAIDQIVVAGNSFQDYLNLPILPNGVVYDSITRVAVPGAVLTMVDAATLQPLPETCFDDTAQQGQVTPASGFYRFDINFDVPACPTSGSYLIQVTEPSSNFEQGVSRLIPPQSDETTAPFDVPACLGGASDALPSTADICEVVTSPSAPPTSVEARSAGTLYYLHLQFNDMQIPGENQLFNNHIPLDPILDTAVAVRKVAGKVNVSRGDLVPYTITIENAYLSALQDLTVVDIFPPGFKYVEGSARYNGQPQEPVLIEGQLRWENIDLELNATSTIEMVFTPGAGVAEGEYINRAQVISAFTREAVSNTASAKVRVVPDPTLDCSDIYGKVFDDANLNGYPDPGESGIAGARVVSARGLTMTADQHGRFHLTCAAVPNELRGSNFILKVDERSLPSGYRMTTENPRVIRLTRGKAAKFNLGASLHRVVRLDVADGVFFNSSTDVRPQWRPRIPMLVGELKKSPSILRIAYLADVEDKQLVKKRLNAIKQEVLKQWQALDCCYRLKVETGIYWRRGAPPEKNGVLE